MQNFSFLDNLLAEPSPRNSMLMSAPILDPLAKEARKVGTDPFKAPTFSNLAKIREAALAAYEPSVPETTGGTTGGGTGGGGGGGGDSSSDDSGQRVLTEAEVMQGMQGTSSGDIEKDAKAAVEKLKWLDDLKLFMPLPVYLAAKLYLEGKKDAYTYESGNSFRYNDKNEIEKYSNDQTIRMQDVALFGGYFDKDGNFIVVDSAKADLSKPTTDTDGLKPASNTESGSQYQEGTVVLDGQGEVVRSGDGSPVLTGKGDAMVRNGIPITMPTTSTNSPVVSSSNGLLTGATTSPVVTTPLQPVTPITSTTPVVTTPLQPVTPLAPINSGGSDYNGNDSTSSSNNDSFSSDRGFGNSTGYSGGSYW